jgi:hypothetical protein
LTQLKSENQSLKQAIELSQKSIANSFAQKKILYFAKLSQHAYYDFETMKWTSFKVYDRKISEGKIVVIDKQNIIIIGGYESESFDWSTDVPCS